MLQTPLLSLGVVLTLTLGIGVSSTVFTLVNTMLLRPMVTKDPDSFAHIMAVGSSGKAASVRPARTARWILSWDEFQAFRDAHSFAEVTARAYGVSVFRGFGYYVSCNYVDAFYDPPVLGRSLVAGDCLPSATPVAVLTTTYWKNHFQSDPQVIGRSLDANQGRFTIVGVVKDAAVMGDAPPAALVPFSPDRPFAGGSVLSADAPSVHVLAKLKPGVSHREAQSESDVIAARLGLRVRVTSGAQIIDEWGNPIFNQVIIAVGLLGLACGLLYLLVCANVTTLLLSRAATRRQEMAVRASLGAGRTRLIRQLLTESVLLSLISAGASLWIASTLPPKILDTSTPELGSMLHPDWRVFLFTFGIAALAGCGAGLSPALESLRFNLSGSLRPVGRGAQGPGNSKMRTAIIATQLAVSVAAVIGMGLVLPALFQIHDTGLGYNPNAVFTWQFPRFNTDAARRMDVAETIEKLQHAPGIAAVGAAESVPFQVTITQVKTPGARALPIPYSIVTPSYLNVLGVRIQRGRAFTEQEARQAARPIPAIASAALAHQLWPDQEPIGQRLELASNDEAIIVGVGSDTSSLSIGEVDGPLLYLPADASRNPINSLVIEASDPALAARSMREHLGSVPVPIATLIDQRLSGQVTIIRSITLAAGSVLFLALIGIYGVGSYAVTQRVHEIGLRLALGAKRSDIVALFLKSVMRSIAIGLLSGVVLTAGAVFANAQVQPDSKFDSLDLAAFAAGIFVVAGAALLATYIPTHRAARFDPWRTLRDE